MKEGDVKKGQVVKLQTGGPEMTVELEKSTTGYVACVWFEGGTVRRESFLPETLVLVK